MTPDRRVLVVDDDPEVRDLISEYLSGEGLEVVLAADAKEMRTQLATGPFSAVLLDLRLPDGDGFSLAAEIRKTSDTGLIVVSGKDDVVDRVAALEAGADDYITKPFHLRELLARLRSVQRRRAGGTEETVNAAIQGQTHGRVLCFAGWRLELESRSLFSPAGQSVELTSGEFDLLVALAERPKRALSRDMLLGLIHDREPDVFDRSIDMQVGRLRRKIEPDPKRPAMIRTVRNVGYKLDCAVNIEEGRPA